MRDLVFVGYIMAIMLLAFKRPFMFTLVYAYIDIVSPQRLSYFLLNSIPLSLIVFGFAVLGFLMDGDKKDVRLSPRWALIILLLLYCGYTTITGVEPIYAPEKWGWVWKALVFAAFLPLTLTTRLRIEAIILVIVLCASALIVTGGIKTAGGGGGYGLLVMLIQDNSGLYEGSIMSCIAISLIPLILWLVRHGTIFKPGWMVNVYAMALIFACLLIPVGTQARTGIVCIGALGILLLRFARYRLLYLGGVGLLAALAIPLLPSGFTQRADTMKNVKADESASTRIAVWQWTWEFAKTHPMGGGFEAYRQNKIKYAIQEKAPGAAQDTATDNSNAPTDTKLIVDAARAYHSSYFEMLGEQGYPGLLIWLLIHFGGILKMEQISRVYRKRKRPEEAWIAPLANALQNTHIIYMVGALFVGIAFQPVALMFVGIQIGFATYLARRRAEASFRPILNKRPRALVDSGEALL
jgi:putative inorganic carbon (hco3(-)) transporter